MTPAHDAGRTIWLVDGPGQTVRRWRSAMAEALYGPGGFFVASGNGPADHFRTSAHASPLFAGAIVGLVSAVDAALGHPDRLDVVDVGAGRGELLRTILALSPDDLAARMRPLAVEKAPKPADLPEKICWTDTIPSHVVGVLLATEWLDNVPLDVACVPPDGVPRYVMVDPLSGQETLGERVTDEDAAWLARWCPMRPDTSIPASPEAADQALWSRAEIGLPRDSCWASAVAAVDHGLAVAVDYGHVRETRPVEGTLTGYRVGRQVVPVPDGSCDITAHVAMDAAAQAGGLPYLLVSQREALRVFGVDGARPPLALASTDPAGYLRALAAASTAAELIDSTGLGGHYWLVHPRGVDPGTATGPLAGWLRNEA